MGSFLHRGLLILETLESPHSLTEISKKTCLPKSTVSRILRHLRLDGWVVQQHDGLYSAGWRSRSLYGELPPVNQIDKELQELLTSVRDSTGWSINYLSFSGDSLTRQKHVSGYETSRGKSKIGEIMPLATSPSGLAILASMPANRSTQVLEQERRKQSGTPQHTHFNPTLPTLGKWIQKIRESGFSFAQRAIEDHKQKTMTLNCVSVAFGETENTPPLGVACVSKPTSSISQKEIFHVSRALSRFKSSAREIYS